MKLAIVVLKSRPKPFLLIRPTVKILRKEIAAICSAEDSWSILDDELCHWDSSSNFTYDLPPIEHSAEYTISIFRHAAFAGA